MFLSYGAESKQMHGVSLDIFQREKLWSAVSGCVADILTLPNEHIERNLTGIKEKLLSIDCIERIVDRLVLD